MNVVTIKKPAITPVKLETVKQATHIDHNVEDDILNQWIRTGTGLAEKFQKRSFITQTLEISLDSFPNMPFEIPHPPLQSIESFKYYDYEETESVLNMDTILFIDTASDPARIGFKYNQRFPTVTLRGLAAVKIRIVAGYGDKSSDIPDEVKDAIILYCSWRNENRTSEDELPEHVKDLLRIDRVK